MNRNMKRLALVIVAVLMACCGYAQNTPKFTEEDAKQFYRTIEGDYSLLDQQDSLVASVHFTPIWESSGNRFQWLYLEASRGKEVVLQKVLDRDEIGDFKEKYREYLRSLEKYHEAFHAPNAEILVVDDTAMNLTVVKGLLKSTVW